MLILLTLLIKRRWKWLRRLWTSRIFTLLCTLGINISFDCRNILGKIVSWEAEANSNTSRAQEPDWTGDGTEASLWSVGETTSDCSKKALTCKILAIQRKMRAFHYPSWRKLSIFLVYINVLKEYLLWEKCHKYVINISDKINILYTFDGVIIKIVLAIPRIK